MVYTALRNLPNGYNLGFGTLKINNDGNEYLDGNEISDNGDRNKILATIAITAYKFLDRYPDKCIYLTESNEVRTRLYQMAISHAYDELSKRFIVLGDMSKSENNYNLIPFTKGMNYNGFLIKNR